MDNKPKIKIAFCIPSLAFGGMERVMSLILNKFSENENELHLVLFGRNREINYAIPDSIIIHFPSFSYDSSSRITFTFKSLFFIRNTIKTIKPDTILSFGEYWNNLVLLALFKLKYPVYISDRSQPNKNLGTVQNKLRDILYPTATGYIAQTVKAKEIAAKNNWNKNITVIGNPINQVAKQTLDRRENIIITVGRLIPTKHIDELIEIFSTINDSTWELIIVGGNAKSLNLLDQYQNQVQKLGLEKQIKFSGNTSDVSLYYEKAKIFAFTSSSEGFPNAIGEALAYGLAVIAYDCIAGPADLITDGVNGLLIEERNDKLYIDKLRTLMIDESLRERMGVEAIEKIKNFDADIISQKFFRFITP
jgi:GalNAc-alpha-(1->4)-GalNAc-alpha-(1->3)-diNAcBac-PP-undecaprenol alpha-1,4-N-acetyl-D-galactosaminyltransferase